MQMAQIVILLTTIIEKQKHIKILMTMTKESINNAVNKIAFVANVGGIPILGTIVTNFNKGYKPAKDFVKNLAQMIDEGKFKTNIDIINYLSNLELNEIVPYTYSKYPKVKE